MHTNTTTPHLDTSAASETADTPTPWQVVIEPQVAFETDYPHPLGLRPQTRIFISSDGMTIAELPNDIPGQRWNAAFICRAVNSHYALVAALRDACESLTRLDDKDGAYRVTALAQAREALASIES